MDISIGKINRIVIFLHPESLANGSINLVTFHDSDKNFDYFLKLWQEDERAICVYDGPPGKSSVKNQFMMLEWFPKESGGLWQVIGFWDTRKEAISILPTRKKGRKQRLVEVQMEEFST
jgi:hypothetical protein